MEYKITYAIELQAETPEEAALIVEDVMKNGKYRPSLCVTDSDGNSKVVDLECSELSLENIQH